MGKEIIWNLIAKKLSGEATAEELTTLESLLRNDPELHYPIQAISDLWHSNQSPDQEAAKMAFEQHIERMRMQGIEFRPDNETLVPEKVSAWKRPMFLFSILLFLLGLFITVKLMTGSPATIVPAKINSEISTHNGSRTNLQLPDGSQVWLNAGSKLSYDKDYGNNIREVSLIGEAYFDVEKNPEKPFIIHTGKIEIKVLGTAFNVKSYPGEKTIETSLIRGSIEVTFRDRPNEKVVLKPNEKLVVANEDDHFLSIRKPSAKQVNEPFVSISHLNYAKKDSTVIETAWVQHKLFFRDESFNDLARQMQRWYGIEIQFDNSQRDTLHFTGSFEDETIQQALDALKLTAHFNYSVHGNMVSISK
jgi:transmembrane sensor